MDYEVQILSGAGNPKLPESAAVYAIFSTSQCRYIGVTDNLHQAIKDHFKPTEPNVPLRYFMQSNKVKILQYELVQRLSVPNDLESMKQKWVALYNPTQIQASILSKNRLRKVLEV